MKQNSMIHTIHITSLRLTNNKLILVNIGTELSDYFQDFTTFIYLFTTREFTCIIYIDKSFIFVLLNSYYVF